MSRRHPPGRRTAIGAFACAALVLCCAGAEASARCAAFIAAELPFFICTGQGGGFWLSVAGQPPVRALRLEDATGPHFLLSMDYEAGDGIGAWAAATDFVVTLRRDSDGPHRGALTAEFCGPVPVPVWQPPGGSAWRSCRERVTILPDPDLPALVLGQP